MNVKRTKCEKQLNHGDSVIFYDEYSKPHSALVTEVWGEREEFVDLDIEGDEAKVSEPGCNLLFVSTDKEKHDSYGRQIERFTSCVHVSSQGAPGYAWSWSNEKEATLKRFQEDRLRHSEQKAE